MKKVPDDKCKWCDGIGIMKEVSLSCPCPDCRGTGYKYGQAVVDYQEHQLNIMEAWYTMLLDILVESFGFPEKKFIPKDAIDFVMNYFALEEEAPPKEVLRLFMIEELEEDFFLNFRPLCYGHVLDDGRVLIYLSLPAKPKPMDDKAKFFKGYSNQDYSFYVKKDDSDVFLQHVKAEFVDEGVIQFSKDVWKNFPSSIPLAPYTVFIR